MKKSHSESPPLSVVMLGGTGAVGRQTIDALLTMPEVVKLSLLGRRSSPLQPDNRVHQHTIDLFTPSSYQGLLPGHRTAICTLGVGQPSKISREEFLKVDQLAVVDFASQCKKAGVRHFEILASIGADSKSASFYLRSKGQLLDQLKALNFERLSIFQPSMILTPTNRYGLSQAIILRVWPWLKPMLLGGLRKYRGVTTATLGKAMAFNLLKNKTGTEALFWDDFQTLAHSISNSK